MNYTQEDINRFYSKIDIIEEGPDKNCWNTSYAKNKYNYSVIGINGANGLNILCHRFMYQIHHPEENIASLQMYHTCDHNWCVNPDHIRCYKKLKFIETKGPFKYTQNDIERFYSHIDTIEDGPNKECWESNLYKDEHDHIRFSIGKINVEGHRFMYQIHHPNENIKGLSICHKCDHPWCINPNHLWLGTHKENMADRNNKNRQAKGEKIGISELTNSDVRNMMDDILKGRVKRVGDTSKKYNISVEVISQIMNKRIWTHITKDYDMIKIKSILIKGLHGCNNINSKFEDCDIRDIRKRLKSDESQASISRIYNVYSSTIYAIKNGKTYSSVV